MINWDGLWQQTRTSPRSDQHGMPEGYIPIDLASECSGLASRVSIVFVHGLGETRQCWTNTVTKLESRYGCLRPDLRGHGASPWSASGSYRLSDYSADMQLWLGRKMTERVTLVGHSLGAAVCIRLALLNPKRIERVVLVDYSPQATQSARAQVLSLGRDAAKGFRSLPDYMRWLKASRPLLPQPLLLETALANVRSDTSGRLVPRSDPQIWNQPVDPSATGDNWLALERLQAPTFLIRGQVSSLVSKAAADEMVSRASLVSVRTVGRAGHHVMSENNPDFLRELVSCLDWDNAGRPNITE